MRRCEEAKKRCEGVKMCRCEDVKMEGREDDKMICVYRCEVRRCKDDMCGCEDVWV